MTSLRTLARPARRALAARMLLPQPARPLSTTPHLLARVSQAPPIDPPRKTDGDLGVGELEGADFKIKPMRRVGEDDRTMRARLVYQSRKRGILESDLLLSTFADRYLPEMSRDQMMQYDLFLDENDWDIYYWATQELPGPDSSSDGARGGGGGGGAAAKKDVVDVGASSGSWKPTSPFEVAAAGKNAAASAAASSEEPYRKPGEGEWAQTVGTFKPAYRPVPARWRDSEVLRLLREHVKRRSKGGEQGGGMGFMPNLRDQ